MPPDRTEPYPIGWPCAHCADLVWTTSTGSRGSDEDSVYQGSSVFRGYWNRQDESARVHRYRRDALVTPVTSSGETTDGYVFLVIRDRMVKRRIPHRAG